MNRHLPTSRIPRTGLNDKGHVPAATGVQTQHIRIQLVLAQHARDHSEKRVVPKPWDWDQVYLGMVDDCLLGGRR